LSPLSDACRIKGVTEHVLTTHRHTDSETLTGTTHTYTHTKDTQTLAQFSLFLFLTQRHKDIPTRTQTQTDSHQAPQTYRRQLLTHYLGAINTFLIKLGALFILFPPSFPPFSPSPLCWSLSLLSFHSFPFVRCCCCCCCCGFWQI
jgi:hypothetical protein